MLDFGVRMRNQYQHAKLMTFSFPLQIRRTSPAPVATSAPTTRTTQRKAGGGAATVSTTATPTSSLPHLILLTPVSRGVMNAHTANARTTNALTPPPPP